MIALERADYALLIALGSLVAALLALGFQLWESLRIDRAVLKVTVRAESIVGPRSPSLDVISVRVVNRGKRPTKLTSMFLCFAQDRWAHRRFVPQRFRKSVALMLPADVPGVPEPELPQTLDIGGEATIFYQADLVRLRVSERDTKPTYCYGVVGASTASGQSALVRLDRLLGPDEPD